MTNKYIPASCLEDLLNDVSNTRCRLEYTKDESGYGDEALDAVKWVEEELKAIIGKKAIRMAGWKPETESACGDYTYDVRDALGLSGGKEEEQGKKEEGGLTALSTKLLKDRLDELMQSAAERSVSDSIPKIERACYQAKEDAYEVALSLIEINEEWQKKLAEAGKKA